MAAVTADVSMRVYGPEYTHKFILDSSAAEHGYRGEPLVIDQSLDTVNVTFCHDTTTVHMTATDVFVGVAMEEVNNAISVAEDLTHGVNAWIEPTILGWKSAVFTNANIGATVYWESGALSTEGTDTPPLGKLMFVEDGYAYIKLSTAISTAADS